MSGRVQRSNLAGTWYPGESRDLGAEVDRLLEGAAAGADPEIRALVVPHAGYRYSGPTAATAWARIPRRRWRRAAILAPSHYRAFHGAVIFRGEAFETPLGPVAVDAEGVATLGRFREFRDDAAPFGREHAVEIQLPFLQRVDPRLTIVPVLVGGMEDLDLLAPGLRALDDGETLFVVSSDFTHYGERFDYLPFPPAGPAEVGAALRRLDMGAIDAVLRHDADRFAGYVAATGITVCGRAPLAAFLRASPPSLEGRLLCYTTSLDVTGDFEHSVSYAAIAFGAADGSP